MDALESLVHKAVTDYAGTAVRVASLEEAVRDLKTQIAQALTGINESLRIQATILEKLNNNIEEHKNIHRRITDIEDVQEDLDTKLTQISARVDVVERGCLRAGHETIDRRVSVVERRTINHDKIYAILNSKWGLGILGVIILGAITDLTYHYDLIKRLFFK
jgi:hypothetical protein